MGHPSQYIWWPFNVEPRGEPQTREGGWETIDLWATVGIHMMMQVENPQWEQERQQADRILEYRIRDMGHVSGTQRELKSGLTIWNQRACLCLGLWGFQEVVLAGQTTTLGITK